MAPITSLPTVLLFTLPVLTLASVINPQGSNGSSWQDNRGGNWQGNGNHAPWKPTATWDPYYPTASASLQASPVVVLPSGPVIGTTTSVASATATVNKFLGIPFAQSPPERFSPPQDASRWQQPLNATAFKPACIQQFTCKDDQKAPLIFSRRVY